MFTLRNEECRSTRPIAWSRRALLARLVAISAGWKCRGALAVQDAKPRAAAGEGEGEAEDIARVEKAARAAKLGAFRHSHSDHFVGIGDAPDAFRQSALRHGEALGQAFLAYFRGRGFTLEYPKRRMTVITLKDADSYAAMLGKAPGKDVGGHYDLDTNRLVIFDFRPGGGDLAAGAERVNLFTLVHETAHQLCFNAGLLDRRGEVPVCISEGLATHVELWRPGVKKAIGGVNLPRLKALVQGQDWIPIPDLLESDKAFRAAKTEQLAYAECWVLVYWLLKSRTRLAGMRDYLSDLKRPGKGLSRIQIAERSLGPLAKLDRDVKAEAERLLRG